MSGSYSRYLRANGTDRLTLTEAMVLEKAVNQVDESALSGGEKRALRNVKRKLREAVARTCKLAEGADRSGEVQRRLFPLDIRGAAETRAT